MNTNFNPDDAKQHVTSELEKVDKVSESFSKSDEEKIELEGKKQFYKLRGMWSICIIIWISVFIIFHIGLTFAIGRRLLDFSHYQWIVPAIVLENFLQIVGMGYIVTKFLYPNSKIKA